ncbi:MAG TPA: TetR/AcrR family transcriptional regulator [Pseudonocardiaceae bacterium]
MSLTDDARVPQRRRGAALVNALLDAAWDELAEKGYDGFTIESVAERAQTARAVIYRRWATKPELVRAAIAHRGQREKVIVPDTGSLRGDLIELLRGTNRRRAPLIGIFMSARLASFYTETGASFADLRDEFLAGRASLMDQIFDRAVERGEIDPARLTPRVRSVAYDLFRLEVLMTGRPVPDDVMESIIDEIVLPLVRPS